MVYFNRENRKTKYPHSETLPNIGPLCNKDPISTKCEVGRRPGTSDIFLNHTEFLILTTMGHAWISSAHASCSAFIYRDIDSKLLVSLR